MGRWLLVLDDRFHLFTLASLPAPKNEGELAVSNG